MMAILRMDGFKQTLSLKVDFYHCNWKCKNGNSPRSQCNVTATKTKIHHGGTESRREAKKGNLVFALGNNYKSRQIRRYCDQPQTPTTEYQLLAFAFAFLSDSVPPW